MNCTATGRSFWTPKHSVTVNGKVVDLTLKEFELLKLLMKNAGVVLTRTCCWRIFGDMILTANQNCRRPYRTLRQKLGDEGKIIETVRGVGYRLGA